MKTRTKSISKKILYVIATVFLLLFCLFDSVKTGKAFADEASVPVIEQTNVMDDLTGSVIDGVEFSAPMTALTSRTGVSIINFAEYKYSNFVNRRNQYGLYVYVCADASSFLVESSANKIQVAFGDSSSASYAKYSLTYINGSTGTYEGIFHKYRVELTEFQRDTILKTIDSNERVYKISGIEMHKTTGEVAEYGVSKTYRYSGYAQGCGSDPNGESTLSCRVERLDTLSLEVHHTAYRPEGTNGKNDYTHDSLHSVYFAVPNEYIQKYGEMVAVHATWKNAVLKPALVTGNQELVSIINEQLGIIKPDLGYCYVGNYDTHIEDKYYTCGNGGFVYPYDNIDNNTLTQYERELNTLYMLFNSGSSTDSADNYVVQGESIYERLKESGTKYGGELVNGKYAACMFDNVDNEFTEVNIYRDEEYDLTSEVVGSSWWDKFFGNTTTSVFNGIKAIYSVSKTDFTGNIEADCNNLYISMADYDEFEGFYNANKNTSTIYLFRYQMSDYISQEATLFKKGSLTWKEVDTNAYFFQETVNLDFDIIDVTFGVDEETVIPVVMSPIDIIPDSAPPANTTSDKSLWDKLAEWFEQLKEAVKALIISAIAVVVVVLILLFVAPRLLWAGIKGLAKFLWGLIKKVAKWIRNGICLPFKGIKALANKKKGKSVKPVKAKSKKK